MKYLVPLAALLIGCSGSVNAPVTRSIAIDSHGHDQEVVGTILLAGTTSGGGSVTVMIDDKSFDATMDGGAWSHEVDTRSYAHGWHFVQARVGEGASSATAHVNLFFADGRGDELPGIDEPPVVVKPAPPSQPSVPADGLVAHWTFNSGTASDSSVNGHHGTVDGAEFSDGALTFDGSGKVYVPDASSPAPAAIADLTTGTISVRFRYDGITNSGENADALPLLYLGSDEASSAVAGSDSVSIYIAHGGLTDPALRQVYFTVLEKGVVVLCFDTTVTLEQDRTYTYTVSIAPNSHKAYLDGVEVERHYNSGTSEADDHFFASVADPDMLVFGYHLFGLTQRWWHHNGMIDDILIYDRTLTDAELAIVTSIP
jgi:hypothetical protein